MDLTDLAFIQSLIAKRWQRNGFHCWELVEQVQRNVFHREVPRGPVNCPARGERRALLGRDAEQFGWKEIDRPVHGAVARMHHVGGNPADLEHAGVYLEIDAGYVLHTDSGHDTVLDTLMVLNARGWVPRWFVPENERLQP